MPPLRSILRVAARRVLPQAVRVGLVKSYFRLETTLKGPLRDRFERRPAPLDGFEPILPAGEFRDGPIVLVNAGLGPGGVERQIVYTLKALQSRTDRALGLLCLQLGSQQDLDFFSPALTEFSGFVRNAVDFTRSRQLLGRFASRPDMRRIKRQIDWMPWDLREEIFRLAAEFARLKPAVVHGWQDGCAIPAAYAARFVGVPLIIVSTRNVRPSNFIWYRPYMYHAYHELAPCPEVVLVNNSEAGAADYARWLDLPRERFIVKRNGLDVAAMRRADPRAVAGLRARLGIPPDAPVVGSMFRLNEEKRPLLWVETAREIAKARPDCHFVVFGTGPLRREMETAAARRGLAARWHCPGTIADTGLGLSLFDVFLLTSRAEGTPNVVLEASTLGVPVVATEAGGTREAIEDGVTGYLIEQAEPAAIAQRVVEILKTPDWQAQARARGPKFIACRFGLDRMTAETLALYRLPPA